MIKLFINNDNDSFMVQDVREVLNHLNKREYKNNIIEFTCEDNNKEKQLEECKNFIEKQLKNNPESIILTSAYISLEEFPKEEYCFDYEKNKDMNKYKKVLPVDDILKRESDILERLGFVSINNYVGYEYKVAFIYPNEIGKEIIDYINNLEKDVEIDF